MTDVLTKEKPATGLSRFLVLLFAVACGLSAANLYYAQPVLDTIARGFGTSSGTAGLIVSFSQVGYAAGLALLVPVGDLVSRRRLIPLVMIVTAASLVVTAVSPDIGLLIGVALVVGAGSVAAQILVPMAASLASDERRGQVVGTVMSGLLIGILLARTISGIVAGVSSWRVVYLMAAVLTMAMAVVLGRHLPAGGGPAPHQLRNPAGEHGEAAGDRVAAAAPGCASGRWASPPSASSGPPWPSSWPVPLTTTVTSRSACSAWWGRPGPCAPTSRAGGPTGA